MIDIIVRCMKIGTPEVKEVWRGQLPGVPRVGDLLILDPDWTSPAVHEVHWNAWTKTVILTIKGHEFPIYRSQGR